MSQTENKKKKKKWYQMGRKKNKNKSKKQKEHNDDNLDLDDIDEHQQDDVAHIDDAKLAQSTTNHEQNENNQHHQPQLNGTATMNNHDHINHINTVNDINDHDSNDEIGNLVDRMTNILHRLKQTCHQRNNRHHDVNLDRFKKLIDWVDYNESHLRILEQAWTDSSFWPFLPTEEATVRVKKEPHLLLIRLSNTKAGAITVTRSAKVMKYHKMEDIVKHKRYFPSQNFGKLTLTGSFGQREVTWDGLLAHLKQKECCICLEELKVNEVLRLNCGHHFHRHCIERHVQHSQKMNASQHAVCPLCRTPIEGGIIYEEPTLATYRKIPEQLNKSKSFNALPQSVTSNHNGTQPHTPSLKKKDTIKRANTADLTPSAKDDGNVEDEEDEMKRMFDLMAKFPNPQDNMNMNMMNMNDMNNKNHPWNQFGNHLDVGSSDDFLEDEYGNAAQAANIAKNIAQSTHY